MAAQHNIDTFSIPRTTSEAPRSMDRRKFLGGLAAAVAVSGLVGLGIKVGSHEGDKTASANPNTDNNQGSLGEATPSTHEDTSTEATTAPTDEPVEPAEAVATEATEETSVEDYDIYKGMEYADPHQLIGMSEEQLIERGAIALDADKTPEDLANEVIGNLELLLNAGNTQEDKQMADSQGALLPAFANQTYRTALHKGMFGPHADGSFGGGEGVPDLQEFEEYSNRRFTGDPRHITSIIVEGVDVEQDTQMGVIVETIRIRLTNTFPEGLGTDPNPITYEGALHVVLAPREQDGVYVVNLESFNLAEAQ